MHAQEEPSTSALSSQLSFTWEQPSRRTKTRALVSTHASSRTAAQFDREQPLLPEAGRQLRKHRHATPCFAAVSLSNSPVSSLQTSTSGAPVPLWMIASAAESRRPEGPAWRVALGNLAAGATAGCAVEAALYPIDTIKTRLQAIIGGGGFKALWEAGGGKALYAGVWGNLAGVAPASAIFMAFYEPTKHYVLDRVPEEKHYLGPLVAGGVAGLASSFIRVPTEVVKQRLQTGELVGAVNAVRTILAKEGMRGFYQGYGAFLFRDLPFDAVEFVSYEQLKRGYSKAIGRDLNVGETSVIGALAGGFTGVITTPLDVLKTRLMTQGASGRYANLWDATVTIAKQEGLSAFMSGWQPRLIWISLGGFVFFPVLEAAKEFYAPKPPLVVVEVRE